MNKQLYNLSPTPEFVHTYFSFSYCSIFGKRVCYKGLCRHLSFLCVQGGIDPDQDSELQIWDLANNVRICQHSVCRHSHEQVEAHNTSMFWHNGDIFFTSYLSSNDPGK